MVGAEGWSQIAVGVLPALYGQNQDSIGRIINIVEDTIVSDPQTIEVLFALDLGTAMRPWILDQGL
jgi:hypothetical protein